MKIRPATVDDAAALAQIAERTFRETFAAHNDPHDLETYIASAYGEPLQRKELERGDTVLFVEEDEGSAPIAYTQMRRTPAAANGDVEIARFYVDHGHHGRGIAQTLMQAAIEEARAIGGTKLWLGVWEHNPRAIAFYKKCGFLDTNSSQIFLVGSDPQRDRIMSLVI